MCHLEGKKFPLNQLLLTVDTAHAVYNFFITGWSHMTTKAIQVSLLVANISFIETNSFI